MAFERDPTHARLELLRSQMKLFVRLFGAGRDLDEPIKPSEVKRWKAAKKTAYYADRAEAKAAGGPPE